MKSALILAAIVILAFLAAAAFVLVQEGRDKKRRRERRHAPRGEDTVYSGFGEDTVKPGEDPLGEAQIYLAHGNRTMALRVLLKALRRHPERSDIRDKIREIEDDASGKSA